MRAGSATAPDPGAGAEARSRWRDRATCRGIEDPDVFFPVAESGPVLAAQEAAAKAVCARCRVRVECLAFALVALPFGVAGGLTEAERRTRGRAAPAPGFVDDDGGWRVVGGSRREVTAAGRAAVRAGRPVGRVAREFGVSERTAQRWAHQVRAAG